MTSPSKPSNWPVLLALVFAGEAIFFLPFVLPRIFRPTVLEVFEINNTQLGHCFSVYGIVALLSYLFGGPIADRFAASKLMAFALGITAMSGVYLATVPDLRGLLWLYGFWGASTILLFWAAMMRATREWGGPAAQGKAFGFLEGGRGAVAAGIGAASVAILAFTLPEGEIGMEERQVAFRRVILFTSAFVLMVGILMLFVLPRSQKRQVESKSVFPLKHMKEVIQRPAVWLQAVIILCAYSGYRVTDDISLLAKDMMDYSEVEAARFASNFLWLRPVAAITAGILADRISASRMMITGFLAMLAGSLVIALAWNESTPVALTLLCIASTGLGVYGLRGLYFAIMEEGKIPIAVTGSAVGVASVVGYLPDIYMGPFMGHFLDVYPGPIGHQYVMWIAAGFACAGLVATVAFRKVAKRGVEA